MFGYPWLALLTDIGTNRESYDKFLEHGHRLGGALIGVVAIVLTVLCWVKKPSRLLVILSTTVLLAVIAQGILGGFRVLERLPSLAMLHGLFASIVFALMAATASAASPRWQNPPTAQSVKQAKRVRWMATVLFIYLIVQYALGGLIRHPAIGVRAPISEHLGLGLLSLLVFGIVVISIVRTKIDWLRSSALMLIGLLTCQVVIGLLTYAAKFGVSSLGIVAVAESTAQVVSRTAHMVTGVLVVGTAGVLLARSCRVEQLTRSSTQTV